MLENSVSSPHTCSWCLSTSCDGTQCYPPDDPAYFTETNNIFCEEILPLVKNAKLELPLDSADPLITYQFHFEDSGWGQQWESNFDYEEPQKAGMPESCEDNPAQVWWYDQGDNLEWRAKPQKVSTLDQALRRYAEQLRRFGA
jgi:hypothetical protein